MCSVALLEVERGGERRGRVAGALLLVLVILLGACSDDAPSASPAVRETPSQPERVELEGRPSAVAGGPGSTLWFADDSGGADGGRVHLVVRSDRARDLTLAAPGAPVALAEGPDGRVWVVGATGTVARLPAVELGTEPAPLGPVVELGGALVDAVVDGGRLYVGDIERDLVHVLDAATGAPAAPPITVPAGVVRLTVGGGRLWVTGLEQEVTPVDLETGQPGAPVAVGAGPIGLDEADGVLWVANSDDGTVDRLDAATGAPLGPAIAVGRAPVAVVAGNRGDVWVLCQDDPSLVRLDAATGEQVGEATPLPMRPRDLLLVVGGGVWVVGVDPALAVVVPWY